ncbi:TIR domain-containing protein [Ekhidna sp.]
MDRKVNIFIGSASESLVISEKIKSLLEETGFIDCTVWNKGVFQYNQTFLTSLSEASYSFDFGIFVASMDDLALVRKESKNKTRDNVIFEYGLFLGAIGNRRTFVVQEKGVDLPSDLLGYSVPTFERDYDDNKWGNLAKNLSENIRNEFNKSQIQVLPSTSLAIGYYKSFLGRITQYIVENNGSNSILQKNELSYEDIRVQIVLPNSLSDNIGYKARMFFEKNQYEPDEIGDKGRPFPIRFFRRSKDLVVVDMPTTLNAIRPAVNLLVQDSGLGIDKKKAHIERRELENFKRTLEYLVSQDDYSSGLVEVIWEI